MQLIVVKSYHLIISKFRFLWLGVVFSGPRHLDHITEYTTNLETMLASFGFLIVLLEMDITLSILIIELENWQFHFAGFCYTRKD